EPDEPAARRRDANRPEAVRAGPESDQAGGDGGRGASARSAWRVRRVPRIARDAEGVALGPGPDRELGDVGLADHDRAGLAQPADDLAVGSGGLPDHGGAEARRLAGDVLVVLDRDRHPVQRTSVAVAERVGVRTRPLGEDDPKRVEPRVQVLDALQARVDELARRDLAGGHHLRLARHAREDEIGGVHGRENYCARPCRACPRSSPRWRRSPVAARAPTPSGAHARCCATGCARAGARLGWSRTGCARSGRRRGRRTLRGHLSSPPAALAVLLLVLTALAGARLAGAGGQALGAVQLVPTALLLIAAGGLIDIALSSPSPGANADASAVAVALALAEALDAAPPRNLDVELVLAGAGDGRALGMRAYVAARRRAR